MGEYSVGIATKNKIYTEARKLFYHKGIAATSYKDICEAADVNRGLIPYYFKSKDKIASLVLEEYYASLESAVDEYWPDLNPSVRNILIEIFQFKMLEANPDFLRFYAEIYGSVSFHKDTVAEQEEVIRQLSEGIGIEIDPAAKITLSRMMSGTEAELVLALNEGAMREPVEVYVRRDVLTCYYLLGADMALAEQRTDEAFELAQGFTMTCDEAFRCSIVSG